MRQLVSETSTDGYYYRLILRSCRVFAQCAVLLARLLLFIARPLPRSLKERCQSLAQLFKNMSVLIVQPSYVHLCMKPGGLIRAMLDGLLLGALLGIAGAYYIPDERVIFLVLIPFVLVLMFLVSFLSISGDLYLAQQDEFQKVMYDEASAYTLKAIAGLLVLLLLSYLFFRAWRSDVIAHISIVLFLARIIYMVKLVQLRWREMANMDLEDGVEKLTN